MGKIFDIAAGITLGGIFSAVGYLGLYLWTGDATKKELQNHQTLKGTVVEEYFKSGFFSDEYQVSIRDPNGKKVLVDYRSFVAGIYEPSTLNTLFSPGDPVELYVAIDKDFGGNQRFIGLTGKLDEGEGLEK